MVLLVHPIIPRVSTLALSPAHLSINTWFSWTKSDRRPRRPVSIIQQNTQRVFCITAEAMSSLQVRAGIYYRRERLREVCVIRDRAGACGHSAEKKEKQQISVIRVSGACLALDGGRSRRSEWEGETKRKQSQVQHMKHGSDWWHSAERDTVVMATAASPDEVTRGWMCVRRCLTASLFNSNCSRQTPASSDIIVCVCLSFKLLQH